MAKDLQPRRVHATQTKGLPARQPVPDRLTFVNTRGNPQQPTCATAI